MSNRYYNITVKNPFGEYKSKLILYDIDYYNKISEEWKTVTSSPVLNLAPFVINNYITSNGFACFAGGRETVNNSNLIIDLFKSHGFTLPSNVLINNSKGNTFITFDNNNRVSTTSIGINTSYGIMLFVSDDFKTGRILRFQYSSQGTSKKHDSDVYNGGFYWNFGSCADDAMTVSMLNDLKKALVGANSNEFDPNTKPDPYGNGGKTETGGGGGTFGGGNTIFGGTSDSIDIPPLPAASASSAGFITLFNPSLSQLNNLANYMWSDLFSLDTFKKIFADPMDCILGLSIVPVKPASAGTSAVKIGNVSTDVSMNKTSSQYVAVDCGTIDVKEYWGAYLDYAPYTQCEIYLPYVGTKQISVDDVMNKAVHVVYHVDILSGACNAYVKCGDSVLYTFVGQCSSSIPISGNDWTNVLNGAISVAGKIGLAMATGGATALMSGLGAASSIISSSKPTVERSGAMSSTGGLLGIQKPYLILTRPRQALPENQNKYTGYPSFITMSLSDCTGYTEIDSVHLENMSCTDEEAQEIENLLKSGVIF